MKLKSIFIFFVTACLLYFLIKSITGSVFLKWKEKVNVVFYGQNSFFYSFDRTSDTNYIIQMPSDLKSLIPGGYGFYRLGSLGKLVSLERKPDIFQKTYSAATSSIVDFYFYPKNTSIYYDNKEKSNNFPSTSNILFYRSNANWVDRIFFIFPFF